MLRKCKKSNEYNFDNTEGDKVDWLDLVVKNNDLKKFFVD